MSASEKHVPEKHAPEKHVSGPHVSAPPSAPAHPVAHHAPTAPVVDLHALNAETNAMAHHLNTLARRIKPSMTGPEIADLVDALVAEGLRLVSLAATPSTLVPPLPPALAALRKKS